MSKNTPRKTSRDEKGSSLIELLIMLAAAVMILSSALTGVVKHSAQRRMNVERALALNSCRSAIEMLRSVDFATLPSLDGTGFDVPGPNGEANGLTPVPGDLDGLPGEISVVVDQATGPDILYRARVTVLWSGVRENRLSLEGLIGERK